MRGSCNFILKLHGFTLNSTGLTFKLYGGDHLGLVKVSHDDISNHMDESDILGKKLHWQQFK